MSFKEKDCQGLFFSTEPTAALFLVVMGYTRESEIVPKCRAAEWWLASLLPLCFCKSPWGFCVSSVCLGHCIELEGVSFSLLRFLLFCQLAIQRLWVGRHQVQFLLERVEEILKWLPTRYNEPLSSVLHDTCFEIFCLIRAKLKNSSRLELMLRPNAQEAYCVFMVFDLSVCQDSICQEETTGLGITNQGECWLRFEFTKWPQTAWIYIIQYLLCKYILYLYKTSYFWLVDLHYYIKLVNANIYRNFLENVPLFSRKSIDNYWCIWALNNITTYILINGIWIDFYTYFLSFAV